MGLTEKHQELIRQITKGDLSKIKEAALMCLNEDQTVKNKRFCENYKNVLKNNPTLLELPMNIKQYAILEDMKIFNSARYYISDREQAIIENIKRMVRVGEKMNSIGIHYMNSTLLHGESGTGKTTLAKYIAHILKIPLLYLNLSTLIDSHLGETSKNISKVFKYANDNKCVFMLDEIDCISIERGSTSGGGADGEISRITISLMQEIDKLSSDVIVMAATNRIDRIDKALLRRFHKLYEIEYLSRCEMNVLKEMYIEDVGIDIEFELHENMKDQSKLIKQLNDEIAKVVEKQIEIENDIDRDYSGPQPCERM